MLYNEELDIEEEDSRPRGELITDNTNSTNSTSDGNSTAENVDTEFDALAYLAL